MESVMGSELDTVKRKGKIRTFFGELSHRKPAFISFIFLSLVILMALLGPWIIPYDPSNPNYNHILESPSWAHIAGTDEFGRDVLSRLIMGARISLGVGFSSIMIGAVVGTFLGLIAGFFGKWLDRIIMRICDVFFAFPDLVLAIGIVAILGPGLKNVVIAIAFFSTPSVARLVRGKTLEVKEMLFIEAEQSLGAKKFRIIAKHVFPEVIPTIIVFITMSVGGAIISAASLSFLGLGAPPASPAWGAMLSGSREYIGQAFYLVFAPGFAIFTTVLAFNILGDGLHDILDPKAKD